jgi:hypothetical protein
VQDDHWEIVAVQNRYGEACDRRDWALFDEVVAGRGERVASIRSHIGADRPELHHEMFGSYHDRLRRTPAGAGA